MINWYIQYNAVWDCSIPGALDSSVHLSNY